MSKYAKKTKVPVDRSRSEIEKTLERYGADNFYFGIEKTTAVIGFRAHGRMVKLIVSLPHKDKDPSGQTARQLWRVLALSVKAKLEAVESGLETFEQAFLAHVLMPSGATVHEEVKLRIDAAYKTGKRIPLLTAGDNAQA